VAVAVEGQEFLVLTLLLEVLEVDQVTGTQALLQLVEQAEMLQYH
jgi:hypothetical protein